MASTRRHMRAADEMRGKNGDAGQNTLAQQCVSHWKHSGWQDGLDSRRFSTFATFFSLASATLAGCRASVSHTGCGAFGNDGAKALKPQQPLAL